MKLILALTALCSLLFFNACTNVSPTTQSATSSTELSWNYNMLSRVWLYANKLEPIATYQGKGQDTGKYTDVSNMYSLTASTDRFTRYFTPSQAALVLSEYMGNDQVAIIGIYLGYTNTDTSAIDDTMMITRVVPASPADNAGLHKGDRIIRINGIDVTDSNLAKYSSLTTGGVGTSYKITVLRPSTDTTIPLDTITASVTKKLLVTPTVWTDTVQSVPVVQVEMFASAEAGGLGGSDAEFKKALSSLGTYTVAIIDLRGNPGGSVDQCLAMADDLLGKGVAIYELSRYWDSTAHVTRIDTTADSLTAGSPYENHHYVFLQDSGSASCSEIMLSAINNNSSFPLVGTYTYGKGIAQNIWNTPAGGLAVISTTEFRDAAWQNYHHVGIKPTYFVLDPDSQMSTAIRLASEYLPTKTALARRGITSDDAIARINANLGTRSKDLPGAWRLMK